MTAQPHAHVRFRRAIERRALWLAEDAARELPNLPLEDALQLVHLYFERGSPKAEPAARRWLVRYLQRGHAELAGRREGHGESGGARPTLLNRGRHSVKRPYAKRADRRIEVRIPGVFDHEIERVTLVDVEGNGRLGHRHRCQQLAL